MIARETNRTKFVAISGLDVVHHLQTFVALGIALAHAHKSFEVTESLKMVLKIAPAFVEQILVERSLFVDRHEFLQNALAELEAFRCNFHHRSAVDFEYVVHRVAGGLVNAARHLDLGKQAILLLIAAANALQSACDAARGRPIAGMYFADLLDLRDGIAGIALQ